MVAELCVLLHAHVPFVRHPDQSAFYEETWLYEATLEGYLPLLEILDGWRRDGLPAKLTLSLSPVLCAMLADPLLQHRFARYLDQRIELAECELARHSKGSDEHRLSHFYLERFQSLRRSYRRHHGNLLGAFRYFQDRGHVELICTAATHPILPFLDSHPGALRSQILTACDSHHAHFGCYPKGIWLPECAYSPSIEPSLNEAGIQWLVLEAHGVQWATPPPRNGIYAPIATPAGRIALARDPDTVNAIWSRDTGYPGDPRYRDFYRDLGYDRPYREIRKYLPDGEHRGFTGLKYHRIAEHANGEKTLYRREEALAAAQEHAEAFLSDRMAQALDLYGRLNRPPLLVAPFDAELFGHWWLEGPDFLDAFVRKACRQQSIITLTTPGDHLARAPTLQAAQPIPSSWGEGGYFRVWLNEANGWILPSLEAAAGRMDALLARFGERPDPITHRSLKQALRELLLAQASDWPFLIYTGTAKDYATRRIKTHLLRFSWLSNQIEKDGHADPAWLIYLERIDNLFPALNLEYWRGSQGSRNPQ